MNKKKLLILILSAVIILIILSFFFRKKMIERIEQERIKNARIEVELIDDLTMGFLEQKKVSDFILSINGDIIDDYEIDSTSIGEKKVSFYFINDEGIKVPYTYQIEVRDVTPPTILLGGSYRVKKGSSPDFINNILCGDDYDSHPVCTIEGDYNLGATGTYPVVFKAVDSSGNISTKNINLIVYEPTGGGSSSSSNKPKTSFSDVVKEHKTDYTKIGLDISRWQGDIDFDALKEAGVEFVIIRIGTTRGTGGEYVLDPKFVRNIENANRVGIEVGIYFYSYASTKEQALADAEWVLEQIKGYNVSLPIAFDWEEWDHFSDFGVSFYELTTLSNVFVNRLEESGYKGMLYSSKYYLENIWFPVPYDVWLAHYTKKTNYSGDYRMWQLCSNGKVNGVKGDVDINVWYMDKNN